MIQYKIIRSKRKTAALLVKNGEAIIRAPYGYPMENIAQFVSQKERWITDIISKQNTQIESKKAFEIKYNSTIIIRGKPCPVIENSATDLFFDGNIIYMPSGLTPEEIKAACVRIYKRICKAHINERVSFYTDLMGVTPADVKISNAKKRWGSCSSRKRLNFSWQLIMAEESVIDYVVVHELAHTIVMNHSSQFWEIVRSILPDYKLEQAKLNILQQRLLHEDWG